MQPADPHATPQTIDTVRRFNRLYTRQLGLLDRGLLGSEFSLTESRILYEIAHRDEPTATEIARELGVDLGYLSRLLKNFERRRFIKRTRSPVDARQNRLVLTTQGRAAFEALNRAARDQVARLIEPMTPGEKCELATALQSVQRLLRFDPAAAEDQPYAIRPLRIGDIGWITHRQAILYSQEYGWDAGYEALVADILAGFVKNFDSASECAWIAERRGAILGSVFLVRASARVAKLRLLYVEPAARGSGVGRRLVQECIAFARARRYRTLTLWTNDVLVSARRIYQAAGFQLTEEKPHRSFGKDLIGQTWDLTL